MAVITVTVRDDVERKFRKLAKARYKSQKGYLGRAISEAMKQWVERNSERNAIAQSLALLEEGIETKRWKFDRKELYER